MIPINIKVLLILLTKFQPNILSHFGETDLNAWVDVNFFKGRRKFSNGHCDLILLQFFLILISINIRVLLILHTKFHLEFSTRLNFARVDANCGRRRTDGRTENRTPISHLAKAGATIKSTTGFVEVFENHQTVESWFQCSKIVLLLTYLGASNGFLESLKCKINNFYCASLVSYLCKSTDCIS